MQVIRADPDARGVDRNRHGMVRIAGAHKLGCRMWIGAGPVSFDGGAWVTGAMPGAVSGVRSRWLIQPHGDKRQDDRPRNCDLARQPGARAGTAAAIINLMQ